MRTIITNISRLHGIDNTSDRTKPVRGVEMDIVPQIANAWLVVKDGTIEDFGEMSLLPETHADNYIDAAGGMVLPAWVDSHTHLVFAGPRDGEFVDRIKGLSYAEIAQRGGGILNSARKLNAMDEEELYDQSLVRLQHVMATGTGAIEIKSGYGLCLEGELKMLRVIRRLREHAPIPVKATLLAAHAYPAEYRDDKEGYLRLIVDEMLPRVAAEGLADYMDVFCEQGFFGIPETARLLEAAARYGLRPKIHANQLHNSGGVQVGVAHGAVSVDHLECVGEEEIDVLRKSNTMPVLLPGAAFFLGIHYQPARMMIDAGLPVCLATDYNPGSCPSGNVPLMLTIACTQMKMTPQEAINAVTVNGACALELEQQMGNIQRGKKAILILTHKMPSLACIPYDYGNNPVARLIIG